MHTNNCDQCGWWGIFNPPVQPTLVGHQRGTLTPVYKKLCRDCAQDARRTWSAQARRRQAQREQTELNARINLIDHHKEN